jgi:hypothetical protein
MTDEGRSGDIAFLKEALDSLATRRLLVPALSLAAMIAVGKIIVLSNLPTGQEPDPLPHLLVILVVMLGTIAFMAAILRILNGSERPPWQPDSSLWLYGLALIVTIMLDLTADLAVGGRTDFLGGLAAAALSTAIRAPLAPWFVAIAVERPLAWRPGPWLRAFPDWLPPLLLWGFLIVVPLSQMQLMLNMKYLAAGADWSWPAALIDGALATATGLVALALASTAYRRVAREWAYER